MADINPVKTWTTQETLTSTDLNAEFSNVYNNHVSKSTAQTVSGRKTFTGGIVVDELLTIAAAGAGDVKLADFRWDPASGTLADDDGFYIDFTADDDAGTPNETIYARLHVNLDDVSNTTEDGSLHWWVMKAGTLTQTLGLTGSALRPTTTDAVSLGTSTLNFSDLFLDSGGVINFDSGNVTLTHSAGALTNSGTLTNTGLITATAGITSGSNIVSDTDSTDDLGTTTVRWANLYVDSIGDTGQALAITAGANNVNVTAGTLAVTGAATISSTLGVTSTLSAATGSTIGNLTLANGSITDSSGAISFDNENLSTTGTLAAGATTVTGALSASASIATAATARIYLDGVAGTGDTYLYESAANTVGLVVGGTTPALQVAGSSAAQTNIDMNASSGQNVSLRWTEGGAVKYASYYNAGSNIFRWLNNGSTDIVSVTDGTDDVQFSGGISTDGQAAPTSGYLGTGAVKNAADNAGFYTGAGDDGRFYSDGSNAIIDGPNGTVQIQFQGTTKLSSQNYGVSVAGNVFASTGISIGANTAENTIDDVSAGSSSTTLYIGNASINVTSDRRVKKDVRDFDGSAVELLSKARIVQGSYISELVGDESPYGYTKRGEHVMMIAQEMREWCPWAVNDGDGTERDDFYWQVEYERVVPLLVKAVQEQQDEINTLKARLN